MGVPLASISDLEDLYLPIAAADQPRAANLLIKASALLRQAAPHIDARIAAGTLDPVTVSVVVATMVKRFLTNPSGAASETVGPFSRSFVDRAEGTNGKAPIKGALQVTTADLESLRPYQPNAKIGSISVFPALAPRRFSIGVAQQDLLRDLTSDLDPVGFVGDDYGFPREVVHFDVPPAVIIGDDPAAPFTVVGNFSASPGQTVYVDATAGPVVGILSLNPNTLTITVKKIDSTANAVTVYGAAGALIDGASSLVISVPQQSRTFSTDGVSLHVQ